MGKMRYAKKVRLALALLIKLVALVVKVLWWNSTPESTEKQTITGNKINNTNTRCNAHS